MSQPNRAAIKKAEAKLKTFSARGSKCPICRAPFRSDRCVHSVKQAKSALQNSLLDLQITSSLINITRGYKLP